MIVDTLLRFAVWASGGCCGDAALPGGSPGLTPRALKARRSRCILDLTRRWIMTAIVLIGSTGFCAAAGRPNLIWIMADDLGYGDLGCYGQRLIDTPNLDRMAAEGIRFTHFMPVPTVCAPSRSVLMTGQHHGHTRVRGNAGQGIRSQAFAAKTGRSLEFLTCRISHAR